MVHSCGGPPKRDILPTAIMRWMTPPRLIITGRAHRMSRKMRSNSWTRWMLAMRPPSVLILMKQGQSCRMAPRRKAPSGDTVRVSILFVQQPRYEPNVNWSDFFRSVCFTASQCMPVSANRYHGRRSISISKLAQNSHVTIASFTNSYINIQITTKPGCMFFSYLIPAS